MGIPNFQLFVECGCFFAKRQKRVAGLAASGHDLVVTNSVELEMKSETRGDVTVEVDNELDGENLYRWIIKRISKRGLPDIKPMDHSFDTCEEAITRAFEWADQLR